MDKHIMLDIETLGTDNDAAILSIGAILFDADTPSGIQPDLFSSVVFEGSPYAFHRRVDLARTPTDLRGTIDPGTVEWWLRQSGEAREAVVSGSSRDTLGVVLSDFVKWIEAMSERTGIPQKDFLLWSNGPTFDEVIVRSALKRYGMELPISYRNSRCCRTLRAFAESMGWMQPYRERPAHDALSDATEQARDVVRQITYLNKLMVPSGI